MTVARRRPEGCLSDLGLDRWIRGELSASEADGASEHVQGCPHCAARRLELERDAAAFSREAPSLDALLGGPPRVKAEGEPRAKRARPPWIFASALGSLAAAAALVLVARPGVEETGAPSASARMSEPSSAHTRLKGGPRLGFFVRRGAQVFQGQPGESVRPGDLLRFTVSSATPKHTAVLSVDGAGAVSVYHPQGGSPEPALSGMDQPLPSATLLDGTLGQETLYGVFCEQPVAPNVLRAAVAASPRAPRFPDGCVTDRMLIVKEAP